MTALRAIVRTLCDSAGFADAAGGVVRIEAGGPKPGVATGGSTPGNVVNGSIGRMPDGSKGGVVGNGDPPVRP
jgi:hypothetical protein